MSEYAEYVFKKYETMCKNCGASSRKGSLKCWVCGRKITLSLQDAIKQKRGDERRQEKLENG